MDCYTRAEAGAKEKPQGQKCGAAAGGIFQSIGTGNFRVG